MKNIPSVVTHIRLAGATLSRPSHRRISTTPGSKRIRFYIGIKAPSVQPYAIEVMNGRQPIITMEQVLATYGATQENIDTVTAWAKSTGHTVIAYDPHLRLLEVEHDATSIRKIYKATLNEYDDGKGGTFTGRSAGLHVPVEIADKISGVHRIDSRPHAQSRHRKGKQIKFAQPSSGGKTGGRGPKAAASGRSWNPVDLAAHYGVSRNKLGEGSSVGFFAMGGGLVLSVLEKANARIGQPKADWEFIFSDGAQNSPNADGSLENADGEDQLDAQTIQGIVPKAKLLCSFVTNTGVGIAHGQMALIKHPSKPMNISGSWGQARINWDAQDVELTEETMATGVAMGRNFWNAAGDDGSDDRVGDNGGHDDYPASSKFNTGCSGVFDDGKTVKAWSATGGGVSELDLDYTDAQKLLAAAGIKLMVHAVSGKPGRIFGDIAGLADPNTAMEVMDGKGRVFGFGGTSAVSPFSAAAACATEADLGHPLPNFNGLIYKLAAAGKSVCVVVISGSNGLYTAMPGDVINFCGLGVVKWDAVFIVLSQASA